MYISIEQSLQFRSPDIKNLFKSACDLVLQEKPSKLFVRCLSTATEGVRGRVIRCGKKQFIIEVSELEPDSMFSTLVHELTHVAQYLTGKLIRSSAGWIWNNSYYPSHTAYWTRPWEIEAHRTTKRILYYMAAYI